MVHHIFYSNEIYTTNCNEKNSCKFYRDEFIKNLKLSNKSLAASLIARPVDGWKYSSILRHGVYKTIALNMFMDTTNTICAIQRIKDITSNSKEVIYNISYINIMPPDKEKKYFFDKALDNKTNGTRFGSLYINNICPMGGTVSKDGEYRATVLYWRFIKYIMSHNQFINELFNEIHEYFIDKFQDRKLLIYSSYYFPTDDLRNKYSFEVELMVNSRNLEFFSISWFVFYYAHMNGMVSDHLNQTYQRIMLKYKHEDVPFFNSLVKKYTNDVINYAYHLFNTNVRSSTDRAISGFYKVKLGQKLIPISLREIQYQFDIRFKPWREYFVGKKLTNLVINQITPGFPVTGPWLFIKNTDKHLFDNMSQYARMEKSAYVGQIVAILNQARNLVIHEVSAAKALYNDEDDTFGIITKKNKAMTSWLSKEFKILHNKIDDAISHSNVSINMSNVTFCIYSEYVGHTLYDSIFITKRSHFYRNIVSNVFSKEGFKYFEKYIFEICYNLHCMSSLLGIIHGDLHMHNIALNNLLYKTQIQIGVNEPKVLYKLSDGYEYVFDTNFYNITLIDFSRCIINPSKIEIFRDPVLHEHFDLVENMKEFEEQQKEFLVHYLFSAKPEYKEIGPPLLTGISHNFESYFKVLTVLDLFMIMGRFIEFFKFKKNLVFTPYAGCIELVKDIYNQCDLYITNSLDGLLRDVVRDTVAIDKDEWPIEKIIKKTFGDHNIKDMSVDPDSIVDVYNYGNVPKYSIDDDARFPSFFSDLHKNKENDEFIANSLHRRELYHKQVINNIKTLLIIKKRQREKNII